MNNKHTNNPRYLTIFLSYHSSFKVSLISLNRVGYSISLRAESSKNPLPSNMVKNLLVYSLIVINLIIPFFICNNLYIILLLSVMLHIIFTLPILIFLLKIWGCNFYSLEHNNFIEKLNHPSFSLNIAVAIIYPLLWGLFLSLSRYIKMGETIDIYNILFLYQDYIICLFFIIPFARAWVYILVSFSSNLRNLLWYYTESISFDFHLWALQYYDYFRICQLIHKFHFIVFDLFFQYPGAFYKHFNDLDKVPYFIRFTKLIQKLYYNPYILHTLFVSSIILELLYSKGQLFFGVYTLFAYPTILSLLRLYHMMGYQDLTLNMCMSDYIYLNLVKPRYYLKFWFLARNPQLWYGFTYNMSPSLQNIYDHTVLLETSVYSQFTKFDLKIDYRIHGYKSTNISIHKTTYPRQYGVKIGSAHPWIVRIAAFYKVEHGVRWFHTTPVLRSPGKNFLHPFTAKFLKDPYSVLALLNQPGQDFTHIQQLTKNIKNWPKTHELYSPNPNILLDEPKNLINVLEINFVHRFQSLAHNGVIIGTYQAMKNKYGYVNMETMQMRPDMVSYWINNKVYDPTITPEVRLELISYFTSQSGTKIGISGMAGPSNILLSHQQIWGDNKKQYAVAMKPPMTIKADEFTLSEEATSYLQEPKILIMVNQIYQETRNLNAVPYESVGITKETLEEIIELFNEVHNSEKVNHSLPSIKEYLPNSEELD